MTKIEYGCQKSYSFGSFKIKKYLTQTCFCQVVKKVCRVKQRLFYNLRGQKKLRQVTFKVSTCLKNFLGFSGSGLFCDPEKVVQDQVRRFQDHVSGSSFQKTKFAKKAKF